MHVRRFGRPVVALIMAILLIASLRAQVTNYVVGAQDVLSINLLDQPSLSGKFTVEADGTFNFPYIGRVKAGGHTLREVEESMQKALSDGFFRKPQVSVSVEQYRSQQVFVYGEVRTPGAYPLTGDMSLIEVLARAGDITAAAGGEAVIVRPKPGSRVDAPPTDAVDAAQDERNEVLRVDVKELQSGRPSQNVRLRDNDRIYIPRAELIYISGQVKSPNSYPLQRGMTLRQALSLAGGVTDRGATNRIKVRRVKDGQSVEIELKLDDTVLAGDTVTVPERFF